MHLEYEERIDFKLDLYDILEKKYYMACKQLSLLNQKISDLEIRQDRAAAQKKNCFKYNLQLQLVQLETVQDMFYQYCLKKSYELDVMKIETLQALQQEEGEELED